MLSCKLGIISPVKLYFIIIPDRGWLEVIFTADYPTASQNYKRGNQTVEMDFFPAREHWFPLCWNSVCMHMIQMHVMLRGTKSPQISTPHNNGLYGEPRWPLSVYNVHAARLLVLSWNIGQLHTAKNTALRKGPVSGSALLTFWIRTTWISVMWAFHRSCCENRRPSSSTFPPKRPAERYRRSSSLYPRFVPLFSLAALQFLGSHLEQAGTKAVRGTHG